MVYLNEEWEAISKARYFWNETKLWAVGLVLMALPILGFIGLTLLGAQSTPGQGTEPGCITKDSTGYHQC